MGSKRINPAELQRSIKEISRFEEGLENSVNEREARERPVIHGLRNLVRNVGLGKFVRDPAEKISDYVGKAQDYLDRGETNKAAAFMARAYETIGHVYQGRLEDTASAMAGYKGLFERLDELRGREEDLIKEREETKSGDIRRVVTEQIKHTDSERNLAESRLESYAGLAKQYDSLRKSADALYGRAEQLFTYTGRSQHAKKMKTGYVIKSAERTLKTQVLGRVAKEAAIVMLVLGGLIFLSSNMTGNVIGGLNQTSSNWVGAVLLAVGLVAGFFWMKGRK